MRTCVSVATIWKAWKSRNLKDVIESGKSRGKCVLTVVCYCVLCNVNAVECQYVYRDSLKNIAIIQGSHASWKVLEIKVKCPGICWDVDTKYSHPHTSSFCDSFLR